MTWIRQSATLCAALLAAFALFETAHSQQSWKKGIVKSELIFERAPFAECHASTIAETKEGLVVAFFGGTQEKNPDVGIWLTRCAGGKWTDLVEVANGIQSDGKRYPCWNPVLYQVPGGDLLLFYKVGLSPAEWWGMLKRSLDGGRSWSTAERLPDGILGPIKNKPILLATGALLSPSSTEDDGWKVHMELSFDGGHTWGKTPPLVNLGIFEAIQPTILELGDGRLQLLCRSRQNCIATSWSSDSGLTWSRLESTPLPNPNSGIDASTLRNGLHVLVYNHSRRSEGAWGGPRTPLNVAVSEDGTTWYAAAILDDREGEFSYPAVIQAQDNLIHVTYTWKRTSIKHVVLDPEKFVVREIKNGKWPE